MKSHYCTLLSILLLLGVACSGPQAMSAEETVIYVATDGSDSNPGTIDEPLASLEGARQIVRAVIVKGLNGPVRVEIRGGEYALTETVVFSPEDSGTEAAPITYAAYAGETPIFTGGKKVTGWKPVEQDPQGTSEAAQGKLWYAEIPEHSRQQWKITSLYDGTKLLTRARSPEFYVSKDHQQDRANAQPKDVGRILKFEDPAVTFDRTLTYENDDLQDWENITDVEIYIQPKHHWLMNMLPLESIDLAAKTVTFTVEPTYGFAGTSKKKGGKGNKYNVENVIDYLDEPGEWVFNSLEGRVYIWPERPLAEADIRAPYLQEFILLNGVEDQEQVRYLTFEGLTFRHGLRDTWLPGDKALQHDWEMYDKGNAILRLRHTEHNTIRSCVFESSSGTGVRLDLYSQHNTIQDSVFAHLGGTAILLSGYAPGLKDESKFNTVTNNYIHHIGTIYQHSPAVFIAQSGHNKISYNTIHDLDYNAMVISGCRPHELAYYETLKNRREWVSTLRVDEIKPYLEKVKEVLAQQWLNSDVSLFEDLLHARENVIEYNDISLCMLALSDGNAIYFSGMGEGNIAQYNYIHDVTNNRGFIRLDDNSGYTYIRNNVFARGRMMLVMKWNGEYSNNFCIDASQITNKEWYPAPLDKIIFYNKNSKAKLMNKEIWVEGTDPKVSDSFKSVSDSIFFVEGRAEEFKAGQDIIAENNRGEAKVGMLFADPLFDEAAFEQRIYRFKPGSPAEKLGIQPIDLSKVGSSLAPKQ
ncbi:MAG: right-handed parallel beta-helix repeat-containing protein [Verrucomicrobiota bacterium]